jgi:hypothetical protein
MNPKGYTSALLAGALLLALAVPAQAQYGTGAVADVPYASAEIEIDGYANEAEWGFARMVDLTANWNSGYYEGWGDPEVPDLEATAQLLWREGVLYVYIRSEHSRPMLFDPPSDSPWDANQILVGVDFTHGEEPVQDNSWSGWPWNAPNLGPVTYKINPNYGGITLNWGNPAGGMEEGVDPIAAGFVDGVVIVNEDEQWWAVEMAIFADEVTAGGQIGFNVGGAASDEEMCPPIGTVEECTYAWFSWQARATPSAGGDVTYTTDSFGTLVLVGAVSSEDGPSGASPFALRANYPNPFRGATTVVYTLERGATVEVGLYDVLGRRVAVLDEGLRAAGEHPVRVDGGALASGVYAVRLAVDGQTVATRTLLRID